jgi:hypothetical protein
LDLACLKIDALNSHQIFHSLRENIVESKHILAKGPGQYFVWNLRPLWNILWTKHAAIFYFYAANAAYEDYSFCQKIISKCEDHMPKEKAKAFDILHLDVGVI